MNLKRHIASELDQLGAVASDLETRLNDLRGEVQGYIDDKSESWQESDTGQEWLDFVQELERWMDDLSNVPSFEL